MSNKAKISLYSNNINNFPPELKEVTLKYRLDLLRISRQFKTLQDKQKSQIHKFGNYKGLETISNNDYNNDNDLLMTSCLNKLNYSSNQVNYLSRLSNQKEDITLVHSKGNFRTPDINMLNKVSIEKPSSKVFSPASKKKIIYKEKKREDSLNLEFLKNNNIGYKREVIDKQEKKKKKRGIVLYRNTLSKDRLNNLNQMRNYQVFAKGKEIAKNAFKNKKIIKEDNIFNKTFDSSEEKCENEDILKVMINNEEQLIKRFLIPKNSRNLNLSNEGKRLFKVNRNGTIKLEEMVKSDNTLPNYLDHTIGDIFQYSSIENSLVYNEIYRNTLKISKKTSNIMEEKLIKNLKKIKDKQLNSFSNEKDKVNE